MSQQDVVGFLSAVGVVLGGTAAAATAFNAVRQRQSTTQINLVQSYASLVTTLQAEVVRLNQENQQQRDEMRELQRRLVALEKRPRANRQTEEQK